LDLDIEAGVDNGRLLAFLSAHGEVLSQRYNDNRVVIHCRISPMHLGRVQSEAFAVRDHTGGQVASQNGHVESANGRFNPVTSARHA
jgi:GTP-binding protein HflX